MQDGLPLAAVDLGSNSFRLEIGRFDTDGRLQRIQYLKETVRLGGGLDASGRISLEAMQRGWDCLARFGERLGEFAPGQVRAVATQTLREATNRAEFIERGARLLGFPIDVVSGPEEARLIYQGVAHLLPPSEERRLVVDVGGRSTELILGRGLVSAAVASFPVGSVAWSQQYFPNGRFTTEAFARAEVAAQAVLDEALQVFGRGAWDVAYGSSGTAGAVGSLAAMLGLPVGTISGAGLQALKAMLLQAKTIDGLRLEGIKEDRKPVIGGGVAVLCAVFDLLDIDEMQVAQGALRQGALYDLLDREQPNTDLRAASVDALARRFQVDETQADRVSRVAAALHRNLQPEAAADHAEREARKLRWAARLHEVGCLVAHDDAHKHGAYILANADAPGFSVPELERLSELVLAQRGKLRKVEDSLTDDGFARQVLSLRLAVALCHARREPDLTDLRLAPSKNGTGWSLAWSNSWEKQHPQSAHLLREESQAWMKTERSLSVAGN
ncbi:Ppx/GppA phosphatase family protein [Xylophilus sp. GOD-11R]|uniref:Ppx/GppA phosphatase family protein n=1 Tax=Xylophilus sp. GOD-11R TaxID=3089814 RepID=UPI00298C23F4|nr:Ppx/GppA phosphatase family protein [Xylophilus sp. GOD-11R]WPB58706.1 Ppx/GppA phosphatase family protein [Xylophilus sp. GOD-11R]